eukprot:TRINITY_DN30707_c0_g1_i1.p1 TRINITY_DN30707_c0_g1~~TRINITY_DN30707_c0_g1_i1.p1  ORF type:complete len:630 (-),score=164.49 TRINITY_DN30707_c0_g1_i1:21-1883(-)
MAEVDNIVLHQLSSVCPGLPSVSSATEFDANTFYRVCVACIKVISPETTRDVPDELPGSTAQKFKACTALTHAIVEAGYTEEIGYNSFMYTESDSRKKVLSFLVNQLPSPDDKQDAAPSVALGLVAKCQSAISELSAITAPSKGKTRRARVSDQACLPFTLRLLRSSDTFALIPFPEDASVNVEFGAVQKSNAFALSILEYNVSHVAKERAEDTHWTDVGIHSGLTKWQFNDKTKQKLAEHVQEAVQNAVARYKGNALSLLGAIADDELQNSKKSRFMKELNFAKEEDEKTVAVPEDPGKSEQDQAAERRKQKEMEEQQVRETLKQCEAELRATDENLLSLQNKLQDSKDEMQQLEDQLRELTEEAVNLEVAYETQQKTIEFANDVEGNRAKLSVTGAEIEKEMQDMREQFKAKEEKLKAQYEDLSSEHDKSKKLIQGKIDEIKSIKLKQKQLAQEIKEKEDLKVALEEELSKISRKIDRDQFIGRIMDIIKNIKKQQNETTKINIDNKELQKEINTTNDAVSRSFIATEDKIYKDATRDDVAKRVYKQLIALRENFDLLISAVEASGSVKQQQHDFEERKSAMTARNDGLNSEQLNEDLENVKAENAQIASELKALKGR